METIDINEVFAQANVVENLKNFAGIDAQNALSMMTPERLAAVVGGNIGEATVDKPGLLSSAMLRHLSGFSASTSDSGSSLFRIYPSSGTYPSLNITIECITSQSRPFIFKIGISGKVTHCVCLNSDKTGIMYAVKFYKSDDLSLYVEVKSYSVVTVHTSNFKTIIDSKLELTKVSSDLIKNLHEIPIHN